MGDEHRGPHRVRNSAHLSRHAGPGSAGIARILREGRRAVAFTYGLTLVENACTLAYPALTGKAVDGLVQRDYRWLFALVAVWLVHLAISFGRQRYDTRVFMGLNAKI